MDFGMGGAAMRRFGVCSSAKQNAAIQVPAWSDGICDHPPLALKGAGVPSKSG